MKKNPFFYDSNSVDVRNRTEELGFQSPTWDTLGRVRNNPGENLPRPVNYTSPPGMTYTDENVGPYYNPSAPPADEMSVTRWWDDVPSAPLSNEVSVEIRPEPQAEPSNNNELVRPGPGPGPDPETGNIYPSEQSFSDFPMEGGKRARRRKTHKRRISRKQKTHKRRTTRRRKVRKSRK